MDVVGGAGGAWAKEIGKFREQDQVGLGTSPEGGAKAEFLG